MKYTTIIAVSFFSMFIIFQSTSCMTGNKHPKETQMLDSMQTFVIKADSEVKTIDSAKITEYANHIMATDQLLQMSHTDTMSPEAAAILRDYNGIRWALLTVAGKRTPLLTELEKSEKQLSHLSHDIQHNLVATDSLNMFIAIETKKASELIQVSNMSVSDLNRQLSLYTALAPKADSLTALLKNHKKF